MFNAFKSRTRSSKYCIHLSISSNEPDAKSFANSNLSIIRSKTLPYIGKISCIRVNFQFGILDLVADVLCKVNGTSRNALLTILFGTFTGTPTKGNSYGSISPAFVILPSSIVISFMLSYSTSFEEEDFFLVLNNCVFMSVFFSSFPFIKTFLMHGADPMPGYNDQANLSKGFTGMSISDEDGVTKKLCVIGAPIVRSSTKFSIIT